MYLVDTNVISEARKGSRANSGVSDFFRTINSDDCYLCVQTIGEIRQGVENIRRRGDLLQTKRLETWFGHVVSDYADRILSFDTECAQVWGRLMSLQASHPIDKQIAAIALIHDMTLVTRNVDDFRATGVMLLNPFTT